MVFLKEIPDSWCTYTQGTRIENKFICMVEVVISRYYRLKKLQRHHETYLKSCSLLARKK